VPRSMPAAPRMYLVVVYRPLPAAPLVVRCMYTEFGLGYKLQRLERRAEESFADEYGRGSKDTAKGIELEFTKICRFASPRPEHKWR
jgi:hypothetical protein